MGIGGQVTAARTLATRQPLASAQPALAGFASLLFLLSYLLPFLSCVLDTFLISYRTVNTHHHHYYRQSKSRLIIAGKEEI